jgi:hypothetical protein
MFNSSFDSNFTHGIQINRSLTVYVNGHTVDANKQAKNTMMKTKIQTKTLE